MAQANAQNSELDPEKHPSGSRIEKMISGEKPADKGMYGETLRPSERDDDDALVPNEDGRKSDDTHRRTPSTRDS